MKLPRPALSISLLLLAIPVLPITRIPARAGQEGSIAQSMQKLSKELFAAYERRDTTALKSYYAKQPDALYFWERKMTYTWSELDHTMDALVSSAAQLKLTIGEFRSGGSDNSGWFAATFHIERVTPEGQKSSSDGRWTVVAEKIGGRWLIVHEHTSYPLPKP